MKQCSKIKKYLTRRRGRRPQDEPDKEEENSSLTERSIDVQSKNSDTVTDTVTALSDQDIDPWMKAYNEFKDRQPELTADFETHLASLKGGITSNANLSSPKFVKSIAEQLLKNREDRQWRVPLTNENIKIREPAEKLVKFFMWTDPFVQKALSAQPHAALAWCGISLILPLLLSGTTQIEAMLKGLNSISHIQLYWKLYEDDYPRSENQQDYQRLNNPLVELYSHIVEYQASTVCHLSKAQISRAWETVAGSNDWDGRARKIEELNHNCMEIIGLSKDRKVSEYWKSQLETMQRSEESLHRIEKILSDSEMQTQKIYEDQLERSLFEELASDYSGDKDFNLRRSEGTCEWFFKDDRFRHWRDDSTSGLLWVSAGPGCGKSVLSRALIDERRLFTSVTTSKVCYFFFKDGDEHRQHSTDALRAILHQLFAQDSSSSLIKKALDSHKKFGKSLRQMFSELWQILLDCSQSPDAGEVICVLDALDECNVDSRRELIDHIEDSCCRSHPSKLKFLITGRPYNDLEARFNKISNKAGYQYLSGDDKSEEIGKEINIVIDDWVRNFTDYNDEDRRQISECVKRKENRTYLWLHLTIKGIEQSGSERVRDVLDILDELSEEVSDKYEKILDRSNHHDRTKILLQLVLSAAEPLTLDQANVALVLALDNGITTHTEMKSKLWPKFEKTVINLCGLFISVHDKKLYFIHLTARDFLLSSERRNRWKGCLEMSDSHGSILRSCFNFLLLPNLPDWTYMVEFPDFPDVRDFPELEGKFHIYAAKHWPWHFSSYSGNEEVSDLAISLCDESSKSLQNWFPLYPHLGESPGSANPLLVAAYLGLEALVKQLLNLNMADINSKDSKWGQTPLSWASEQGHTTVVEQLLDTGKVDVNSRDYHGGTPLSIAVTWRNEAVVKQLLNIDKVDVNSRDDWVETPFSIAILWRNETIVKQLLNTGKVDVNLKDYRGRTPLLKAVHIENAAIVKQLLDTGKVDVDLRDDNGDTPLSYAGRRGYKTIVKHLRSYKDSQLVRDSRGP